MGQLGGLKILHGRQIHAIRRLAPRADGYVGEVRPCSRRVPSVLTMYLESRWTDKLTLEYSTSGKSATSADHFRARPAHSSSMSPWAGGGSW